MLVCNEPKHTVSTSNWWLFIYARADDLQACEQQDTKKIKQAMHIAELLV